MTRHLWRKRFEWMSYANCADSPDHILPPPEYSQDGEVAVPFLVEAICRGCRVRPECAAWASAGEHGIWAAGRYIPGHDEDRGEAQRVRDELAGSVELERERRGNDV